MRIAYIGTASGTSLQRAQSLERLGHSVTQLDPWTWVARPALRARIHFRTGYLGVDWLVKDRLVQKVHEIQPNIIWVNQCEFLGAASIKALRCFGVPIVNYANDNPFSVPNRYRFRSYRAALPFYDLVVVVFADAVDAARRAGARRVIRKFICADEVAHLQQSAAAAFDSNVSSDVAFVGTYMRTHRGAFIAELIRKGVPLSIWGDYWQKAKEWRVIKPHWRGPGVYDNVGYAKVIRSAKICIGLLNKAAGNLHTGRSVQIPSLGALLCAERTTEHLELYKEGTEAVFWDNATECAQICKELLADEGRRREIARQGYERALSNKLFNEPLMASILNQVS